MTRKCILCQETNFKTKYSFFSAPKDAPTRRKWKEALGIPNYTVCDETYVCSKHFDDRDIITSWASGTPPRVMTIQYKKPRLRPGAVPTTKTNNKQYCVPTTRKDNQYFMHERHDGDDDEDDDEDDDDVEEKNKKDEHKDSKKVIINNKIKEKEKYDTNFKDIKSTIVTRNRVKEPLPISSTKLIINDNKLKSTPNKINDKPIINKPDSQNGKIVSQTRGGSTAAAAAGSNNNNCQEKMITEPEPDIIESANLNDDAFFIKTGDTQQLYYVKTVDEDSKTLFTEDDIINGANENDDNSKDKTIEKKPLLRKKSSGFFKVENYKYIGDDDETEKDDDDDDDDNDDDDDDDDDEYPMWKKIKAETMRKAKMMSPKRPASKRAASRRPASKTSAPKTPALKTSAPKTPASKTSAPKTPALKTSTPKTPASKTIALKKSEPQVTTTSKINYTEEEEDDGMLFEDLLETYTDVTLPSGWCVLVESRGDVTTVIYAYIETTSGGIPWIKKQVFIQNDMLMRCSAGGREIDPIAHKLIKGTKSVQVTDVDDVIDIIREFDETTVCQGTSEKINPADIDNTIGFLDGASWRHVNCSIMINYGEARCKNCDSLIAIAERKKSQLP